MQKPNKTDPARQEALNAYQTLLAETPEKGEATEAYKVSDELAYAISRLPLGTARPIKVIVVGAGFSGLAFAREVETKRLANVQLQVYEKNASVGGTWFENRYPG
jgi:NADPH-dependent 2,4-dienoyl-CoA reductase/sulfur reductase-like enzyme